MLTANVEWLRNPLGDEMFLFLALRAAALLASSAVLLVIINLRDIAGMLKTTIWRKMVTWAVMGPALLIIIYSGFGPMLLLVAFMLYHATAEYLRLVRPPAFYSAVLWALHLGALILVALRPSLVLLLPLLFLLATIIGVSLRDRVEGEVKQAGALLFGATWLGLPLSLFASLQAVEGGRHGLVLLVGVVCLSDVFAVFFGKAAKVTGLGAAPLASRVSPGKTRAGLMGNVVGAALAFVVYDGGALFGWLFGLGLAVLIGLAASSGDLLESLIKRTANVKDSGTLIPAHGGMLDRIDSLLPTIVIFWLALRATLELRG